MKYKHLIYLSFANHIAALAAVDKLPADAEVLEFGQIHAGHVTVWISTNSNLLLGEEIDGTDGVFIEAPKLDLLKGYFKLLNTPLKKNLLILESTKMSHILTTVDGLLKNSSYELIEISRATNGQHYAQAYLANGKPEEALMPAATDFTVRLIEDPSPGLRKLF